MPWTSKHLDWLVDTGKILKTQDGRPIPVFEFRHKDDEQTLSAWAKHFRNHYCLDKDLIKLIRGTGKSKKQYLNGIKFPDRIKKPGPSIRAGDFCEILVADYLEFSLNFWVPRGRYSNKDVRNESKKGCDVVGFKIFDITKPNKTDTLAIYEVKAQLSGRKANPRLQDAIDGSSLDIVRKAETLNAIKQRFIDKDDDLSAERVERFQDPEDKQYLDHFGAAAVFTSKLYNEKEICSTKTSDHPHPDNLNLLIIHGNDLMTLTHKLYERAANEA